MPNKFNFAFDYYIACWVFVFLYLPGEQAGRMHMPAANSLLIRDSLSLPLPSGFPKLYTYMLTQRRKVLRGGRSSSSKQKAQ